MSKLSAILYPVRDAYIAKFESVLKELRSTMRGFVVEPEIRASDGEASRVGALGTIARHDVIAKTPYGSFKAFAVDSDRPVDFPRTRFDEDGLDVGIAPFLWESMEVWADGPVEALSRVLAIWFASASTPVGSFNLESMQGVAHFISDPVSDGGLTSCVIDLGTAPIEAVVSLLDNLRRAGARRVDLGQLQT